jgi:hydrogenase/urease accessory protein HupE
MRGPRRRSWRAGAVAALAVLLACLGGGIGSAHQVNLSTARIVMNDDATVDVEVAMKGSDVDRVAATHVFDAHTGLVRADALAASTAAVVAYVTAHAVVLGENDAACRAGPSTAAPDQDGVVARTRWSCAEVGGARHYRSTVLLAVAPDARQVVLIGAGERAAQDLLDADRTEITLAADANPGLGAVILRYVLAGMQHIFIGYDHICFLIAIILWARKLWPVVKMVTAFTIAHSITLSLAALDIVRIPSAITEPAIAATIIYVAVENFFSHDVRNRWRDTFGFGLIHGFGFASALQEFGLPRSALAPALASFNIGVEIGQVVIVSAALPLLLLVDRAFGEQRRPTVVAYGLSGVIVILAGYWFLDRTVLAA